MAAPPEVNIKNLSGKFTMNKSLSDDSDAILSLQDVGWVTRKAISMATITLHVNHNKGATPETGADQIKIIQVATGGFKGTTETRHLDHQKRSHVDHIFGDVTGQSQLLDNLNTFDKDIHIRADDGTTIDPDDVKFMRAEVLVDLTTPSKWLDEDGGAHIISYVVNEGASWAAEQVWGFEEVEGKRRYTRRVVVRRTGEKAGIRRARLVYDYHGEVQITD